MGCSISQEVEDGPLEVDENSPEAVRRAITTQWNKLCDLKDGAEGNTGIDMLIEEKNGLNVILTEEREKLLNLMSVKDDLSAKREPLLKKLYDKDADDIYKAFHKSGSLSVDKSLLINTLGTRTKSQIHEIALVLKKKYNVDLLAQVITDLTSITGKLGLGGGMTGLSKLFVYRIMPQDERDAALLREFTEGLSVDDENLIEIVFTRSNDELSAAMNYYQKEYRKDLRKIIATKIASYKNFKDFMLKVLECQRDETNKPLTDAEAKAFAEELYAAGNGKKNYGINAEPFVRILSSISKAQFDSINDFYPDSCLLDDICKKLGGPFQLALQVICSDKYMYLAHRLEAAFKSFSADKDCICRVLGCIARWECVKVRDAYDRAGFGRTLVQAVKTIITQRNYQSAILLLIEGDMLLTPLGSDREAIEDEADAAKEGVRVGKMAEEGYRQHRAIDKGIKFMKSSEYDRSSDHDVFMEFEWDGGGLMTLPRLQATLADVRACMKKALDFKEALEDDVQGAKEAIWSVNRHFGETEAWIRTLQAQIKALESFSKRRDDLAGRGKKQAQ